MYTARTVIPTDSARRRTFSWICNDIEETSLEICRKLLSDSVFTVAFSTTGFKKSRILSESPSSATTLGAFSGSIWICTLRDIVQTVPSRSFMRRGDHGASDLFVASSGAGGGGAGAGGP